MDFDFEIPGVHYEKKKYQNFKVTPIDDIVQWRQIQEAKEFAYRIRLKERDQRIAAFESTLGQKLDTPTIHTTSWEEKRMFAEAERAEIKKAEAQVTQHPPWECTEPPVPPSCKE